MSRQPGPYECHAGYAPINDSDLLHRGPRGRDLLALWAAVRRAKAAPQVPPDVMDRINEHALDLSGWNRLP